MKKIVLISALFFPLFLHAQTFSISGKFSGLVEGAKVVVNEKSDSRTITVAEGIVKDGAFTVSGKLDKPTVCTLAINDRIPKGEDDYPRDRGISFMAYNSPMTLTVACFDSIPRNYELGSVPMTHEKNVTINGGKFQDEYNEWRNAVYDKNLAYELEANKLWKYKFGNDNPGKANYDKNHEKELENNEQAALDVYNKANYEFIAAHPNYAISLYLQSKKLDHLFRFTTEELDKMLTTFKNNGDTAGYNAFKEKVSNYRPYARGIAYKDIDVQTTEGKAVKLSNYVKAGKYNIIDFWASWCGPCRASIPLVKRMHEEQPDINIISVSCDRNLGDWKKAMTEENMPWQQLALSSDKAKNKSATEAYRIQFIPYLIIIDPQGKVSYAANSAEEIISEINTTL